MQFASKEGRMAGGRLSDAAQAAFVAKIKAELKKRNILQKEAPASWELSCTVNTLNQGMADSGENFSKALAREICEKLKIDFDAEYGALDSKCDQHCKLFYSFLAGVEDSEDGRASIITQTRKLSGDPPTGQRRASGQYDLRVIEERELKRYDVALERCDCGAILFRVAQYYSELLPRNSAGFALVLGGFLYVNLFEEMRQLTISFKLDDSDKRPLVGLMTYPDNGSMESARCLMVRQGTKAADFFNDEHFLKILRFRDKNRSKYRAYSDVSAILEGK
jgi:hypothetical protein